MSRICNSARINARNRLFILEEQAIIRSCSSLVVGGKELSKEQRAKILGVTISKDLKWNGHVYN